MTRIVRDFFRRDAEMQNLARFGDKFILKIIQASAFEEGEHVLVRGRATFV